MEGSVPRAPMRRPSTMRVPWGRSLLVLVAAFAAIVLVSIVAMSPDEPAAPRTSTVEDGGLEWGPIVVIPDGDVANVQATVELDDAPFPAADGADDRFVMYQLAGGRFDTNEHVDDRAAERVLGFRDRDRITLAPVGDASNVRAIAQPRSGEYTLSLDGEVTYEGVPSGTWDLRAYVVDRSGSWDGPVAVRRVTVR
ncbi:MAG: hypothetical protein JWL76_1037 [Thermoleophilia bacterium]|nr:hypothetical protein [Thermoleophilia bacterium]